MSQNIESPINHLFKIWLDRDHAYQTAATSYGIYGLIYLAGAIAQLTPGRQITFFGFVPWWFFYLGGVLLVLLLPVLIWRRPQLPRGQLIRMWYTRILAFGPAVKALSLLWKQSRLITAGQSSDLYNWFFCAIAIVASLFLFRAGWGSQERNAKMLDAQRNAEMSDHAQKKTSS